MGSPPSDIIPPVRFGFRRLRKERIAENNKNKGNRGNTRLKNISIDSGKDRKTQYRNKVQGQGGYKIRKHKTKSLEQEKKTPRQEGNKRVFMYKKWKLPRSDLGAPANHNTGSRSVTTRIK